MVTLKERAEVLVEALPYIQKFHGKTVVIKVGGNIMVQKELKKNIATDIVMMWYVGMKPVVVHGGGPQVSELMEKLGKEACFADGLRVTDEETLEVVEMVLEGKINKELVRFINEAGGTGVGISGKDGNLIEAQKFHPSGTSPDVGFVGEVVHIRPDIIRVLEEEGFIPVIAPLGVGKDGCTYNINADSVAGKLAAILQAEKLIILTDTRGIMREVKDDSSIISTVKLGDIDTLIKKGIVKGGMLPKVKACETALRGGVGKCHVINGSIPHSLLLEIFTDEGVGTQILA